MSLRDQLLKSGLASKQQAKKSAKALKKKKYQQNKAQREDPKLVVDDDITIEIKKKKKKLVKKLISSVISNWKKKKNSIGLLVCSMSRNQPSRRSKSYYFTYQTNELLSIPVSDKQRDASKRSFGDSIHRLRGRVSTSLAKPLVEKLKFITQNL